MKNPIIYFISGFFTAVAIAVVVLLCLRGSKDGQYDVHVVIPSPDGKHIATAYSGMGGGAAGWCSSYVSVNTVDEREKIKDGKGEYETVVFDGSCSTAPSMQWETDGKLIIKYKGPKDRSGVRLYKRALSRDDLVQIKYQEM